MRGSRLDSDMIKVLPVLVVFFLLLKAYVVARYSLTTTGALVTAAPFTVLVGTVTSYLNIALLVVGVTTASWLFRHRNSPVEADRDLQPLAFGVVVVSVLFLPLPVDIGTFTDRLVKILVYVVGVSLGAYLLYRLTVTAARRLGWPVLRYFASRPTWYLAAYLVVLLVPTLRTPWVPAEVLVLRERIAISDSHPVDGRLQTSRYPVVYVLDQNSEWTTALDVRTRFLLRLPSSTIAHRQVCRYRDQPPASIPLFAYVSGQRYASPNTVCHTLVEQHARLLDPLVARARGAGSSSR